MKSQIFCQAAVLLAIVVDSHACTEYTRMEDGSCAQICLGNRVKLCSVSLVAKVGNLKKGNCARTGFTHDTGTTHTANAGPCGKITFKIYKLAVTAAPAVNHDASKCTDNDNDCCASPTWGEPQTCNDGYVARPIAPQECPKKSCSVLAGGIGCYSCFPPPTVGTCEQVFLLSGCECLQHMFARALVIYMRTRATYIFKIVGC